jgi:hypothetical protein
MLSGAGGQKAKVLAYLIIVVVTPALDEDLGLV